MIPDIVYKFRDWSNPSHKTLLTERKVWFAQPTKLNDPFDCGVPFRYDLLSDEQLFEYCLSFLTRSNFTSESEWLAEAKRGVDLTRSKFQNGLENGLRICIKEHRDISCGVFSCSKSQLHPLLWSHYAKGHEGLCIGIKNESIQHAVYQRLENTGLPTFPLSVVYTSEYPVMAPTALKFNEQSNARFCHKPLWWAYEEEIRWILAANLNEEFVGTGIDLAPNAFAGIYLGCNMPADHEHECRMIIRRLYPSVPIFKMQTTVMGEFGLKPIRLD